MIPSQNPSRSLGVIGFSEDLFSNWFTSSANWLNRSRWSRCVCPITVRTEPVSSSGTSPLFKSSSQEEHWSVSRLPSLDMSVRKWSTCGFMGAAARLLARLFKSGEDWMSGEAAAAKLNLCCSFLDEEPLVVVIQGLFCKCGEIFTSSSDMLLGLCGVSAVDDVDGSGTTTGSSTSSLESCAISAWNKERNQIKN